MHRSFFLYIHGDMSGDPDWNKSGKVMTPYSAVRVRQRFCSKKFQLEHLFFGYPPHIDILEDSFKEKFVSKSGTKLTGISSQSELFNMSSDSMRIEVNKIISEKNLFIKEIILDKPYDASNSSECPLGILSELNSHEQLTNRVSDIWGDEIAKINKKTNMFYSLFEISKP